MNGIFICCKLNEKRWTIAILCLLLDYTGVTFPMTHGKDAVFEVDFTAIDDITNWYQELLPLLTKSMPVSIWSTSNVHSAGMRMSPTGWKYLGRQFMLLLISAFKSNLSIRTIMCYSNRFQSWYWYRLVSSKRRFL